MAGYALRDAVRAERARREQHRRLRTTRPRRGGMPTLGWSMEGPVTLDRFFLPGLATIDPRHQGYLPEYKAIVGVDGWLFAGTVTVRWQGNDEAFFEDHVVDAGGGGTVNRIWFDGLGGRPDPFIIENGDIYGGEFPRPEIQAEPEFPSLHLVCFAILDVVPV